MEEGRCTMCQALREIMQPEIDEAVAEAINSTATNLTVDVVGGLRKGST